MPFLIETGYEKVLIFSDSLMSEEIFGPLLPIMKADYRKACEITNSMDHPLGLYIFSSDQKEIDESKSCFILLAVYLP